MSQHALPIHKRLVNRLLNHFAYKSGGYTIPFLEEMLRHYSVAEVFRIFGACTKIANALTHRYGPRDANVLIGFAAVWNGCRFCSRGHIWAANLYHLRDTGELFPLDDADVHAMQRMPDEELLSKTLGLLQDSQYARLRQLLQRQYHLKRGEAVGSTDEDDFLRAAIAAWDWMVECTIVVDDTGDVPADPISSDRALLDRYLTLRGRKRR